MMTTTTTVPELLDRLCVTQEHNTALQKYWLLARSTHPDYSIIHNSTGEFLLLRDDYIYQKNWYQLFCMSIMMPEDILVSSRHNRWFENNFIGHVWPMQYKCIAKSANNASYSKQIHGNWQDCTSHWKYWKHHGNKSTLTLWWNFQNTMGMELSWCA